MPALLFLIGALSLAGALVGEGLWDVAGWAGLATLVATAAWFSMRRKGGGATDAHSKL